MPRFEDLAAEGQALVEVGGEVVGVDVATQAELDGHATDTTDVHGIADTSLLETTAGAQAKADAAEAAANTYTDNATSALPFVVDASVGDGVTNARSAIQAELDAASAAGGGVVLLPPGTYMVDMAAVPGFAGYYAGIILPSGVILRGAGEGATVIKLIANEVRDVAVGEGAAVICNKDLDGAGDTDLGVEDLTVDGNSVNQTKVHNGITMVRTRHARFARVTVKNVRGTANFPPNETFHFDTQLGMDTTYVDCSALGDDAGATASGFSANRATGVHYVNCIAHDMSAGMGFTHWMCEEVSHVGCHVYLNADNGFNSEGSRDVTYTACHAGGEVADGTTPWPLAAGATLGNGGSGFVINGTRNAVLVGCVSRENSTGIGIIEGTAGASGRVVGCAVTDNTAAGITFSSTATEDRWAVADSMVLGNNGGATEYVLGTGVASDEPPGSSSWVEPAVGTGWTIQGAPYEVPRYRKVNGIVYIEGLVLNNSGGALGPVDPVFNLPVGFRPRATVNAAPFSAAGMQVTSSGAVQVNNSIPNSTFLTLHFSFPAEG